jgi:hypothetical protein
MDALADFELLFTAACVCESETLPFFATHKRHPSSRKACSASIAQDQLAAGIIRNSARVFTLMRCAVSVRGSRIETDTNLARYEYSIDVTWFRARP